MTTRMVQTSLNGLTVYQIIELEIGAEVQEILNDPAFTPELDKISWLQPHYVTSDGAFRSIVQSLVFRLGERVVVVDTCLGNDKERPTLPKWHHMQTDFLRSFRQTGLAPEDVTDVLCTHMHLDHVGWNTCLQEGRMVPTFPKAKYYFSKTEWAYWQNMPREAGEHDRQAVVDSVLPVVEAGQAVFVSDDADLGDGLSLVPTPGHTPGHVSIRIQRPEAELFITGDCIHHPAQIARAAWSSTIDVNRALAAESRRKLLQTTADRGAWLIGSHFALPSIGRVVSGAGTGDDFVFQEE